MTTEQPVLPVQAIVRFAADALGFPLLPKQADILSAIYRDNIRTAVLRLGRRSGKGRMAAVVATFESTVNAHKHLAAVPPGEQVAVVVVATSRAQARIIHRFIRGFFQSPALAPLVSRDGDDEIELSNGMLIATLPCSTRSTRGYGIAVLIFDELAWFIDSDGSPLDAGALWDALVPSTATFNAGRVMALSTPRWNVGFYADLCRQASSGEYPDMRHWHATTAQMRPDISLAFLGSEAAKDPAAFRREYEAEWDSGIGAAFDEDTVRAAVASRGTRSPEEGHRYAAAVDAAYLGDAFALGVAHMTGDRLIVDRLEAWAGTKAAPLSHREVLGRVADIARGYDNATVALDQFAAEPVRQGLAELGVMALPQPWTAENKAVAVTTLRQLFFQGRIELPDDKELVAELLNYEQSILPSGRPRYGAAPGSHDDRVSVLLSLASQLAAVNYRTSSFNYRDRENGAANPVVQRGDLTLRGERYVDQKPHIAPWR